MNCMAHGHALSKKPKLRGWLQRTFLIMRLTAFLLLAAVLNTSARSLAQTVSYEARGASLIHIFSVIEKQTGYVFIYNDEDLTGARPVTVRLQNSPLRDALSAILHDQPLAFNINGNTIVISRKDEEHKNDRSQAAPPQEVRGQVTDGSGQPLSGASVVIKGSAKSTMTNEQGEFTLHNVPNGKYKIEISYVGYDKVETEINVADRQVRITVEMKQGINNLDAPVIKGYYNTTKRLNTGNVSTVKAEDIAEQPVSNPLAALEGRVPGLFITQTTGAPGGGFTVRIRGQNSLGNGNDPFYVIDGVPYPSQTVGLINGVLNNGSPLNYISPSDIESIEVLKDADATSIYGSRAANGAILITTKKGKAGKMRIDVNAYSGVGKVTRKQKLLNTQQYLQMRHEAFYNDSIAYGAQPNIGNDPDLLFWDTTRYTDWQKVLLDNTAHYYDAQASVSGGNTNTQYLIGGGYHRETTVFPVLLPDQGADQKISINSNVQTSSENKRFKLNFTSTYVSDYNTVQPTNYTTSAYSLPPNAPAIFNSDGSLNWAPTAPGQMGSWFNPFALLYQKYKGRTSNLVSSALISYNLLPGLVAKVHLGYTNTQTNEIWTGPTASADPGDHTAQSYSVFNATNTHSWIAEPQAEYKLNLGKEGVLSALAGLTFQENNVNGQNIRAVGFASDALLEDIQSAGTLIPASTSAQYKYNAIFGRLNYNWGDKYILNITGRRDASSRFGPGRQFANFGAIGAAWIFTNEHFFKEKLPFLSFGKLRASYGTSGNDQIPDYGFIDLYRTTNRNPYQGIQGLYPQNLFNSTLAWELDKKLECGLDLGMLKDKILFNISYFRHRSGNQLVNIPLPSVTGFSAIYGNLPALVQNTGVEIGLTAINVRTKTFSWSTSANLSVPRNKLVSFPDLATSVYQNLFVVGQPIGVTKAFHSLGVNDTTGLYQFATVKGEPTYYPNYGVDNTVLIVTAPRYYGGLRNTLQYKSFTLDFLFQFVKQTGLNIFGSMGPMPGVKSNQPVDVLDHWHKPGDSKPFQQFSQNYSGSAGQALNNLFYSDYIYSDASFIRLKNLSLSYAVPGNWKNRLKIQTCRLFIQGQNLLTITDYKGNDPESQSLSMPPLRVWTAGFQITL